MNGWVVLSLKCRSDVLKCLVLSTTQRSWVSCPRGEKTPIFISNKLTCSSIKKWVRLMNALSTAGGSNSVSQRATLEKENPTKGQTWRGYWCAFVTACHFILTFWELFSCCYCSDVFMAFSDICHLYVIFLLFMTFLSHFCWHEALQKSSKEFLSHRRI